MATSALGLLLTVLPIAQAAVLAGADTQYSQKIPGNNDGYYDDQDYLVNRVFAAAAAGLVIAVLSFLAFFCFCCVQVCAKCGCTCIKKCCSCCGASDPDPNGYTRSQRLALVGILFLAWAFIICGSGLAYDGNGKVKDGIDTLSATATTLADEVYAQVQMGYDAAVLVSTSTVSTQMLTDADSLRSTIKDTVSNIEDTDNARILAVYIFYGVMMAIPLLGFMSWICGVATCSYIMAQIAFCLLFVAWLLFAVTFAAGSFLDDTCVEAGKQVYGETNTLSELLKCGDTSSSLATYEDVWQTLDTAQASLGTPPSVTETTYGFTTDTYSAAASVINSAEYARNRDMLIGMYTAYGVDATTCETVTDNSKIALCYVPGITSSTYSSMCGSGGTEPSSARCLKQSQILAAAGMTGSSYIISCEHLNVVSLDLNNNVCDDMVGGLVNVCVGQAFIAFFYFFVLAVGCSGMNRFNSDNSADNAKVAQQPHGDTQGMMMSNQGGGGNIIIINNAKQKGDDGM